MAKFYGKIGYAENVRTAPGVTEEQIIERDHFGEIMITSRRMEEGEKVIPDISVGNYISIVADAYANEHFFAMKYATWAGTRWTVSEVTVQRPRLLLRLGGVYNGPKATVPDTP